MGMFYIIVNIETPLKDWNVYVLATARTSTETSKQTSKQDVLMDAGECLTMDSRLTEHTFLDKRTVTVLLACAFFW